MVRLKLIFLELPEILIFSFQSHNGSIKTVEGTSFTVELRLFQSHNGSIKTSETNH